MGEGFESGNWVVEGERKCGIGDERAELGGREEKRERGEEEFEGEERGRERREGEKDFGRREDGSEKMIWVSEMKQWVQID